LIDKNKDDVSKDCSDEAEGVETNTIADCYANEQRNRVLNIRVYEQRRNVMTA
jgi:hypothetical protein